MNLLKCREYNEFVIIINREINSQEGIVSANERLYKKNNTNYQVKQLKRPPMVKSESKKISTLQNNLSLNELLKMAWTMKQLDVFNKVHNFVEKQIQFYRKQLRVVHKIQQSSNLVTSALKSLETQDIIQLKAWEIIKIQKQVEIIQKRIDKTLITIGVVPQNYEEYLEININKIIKDHVQILLQGLIRLNQGGTLILGINCQYEQSQIQSLIDFLSDFAKIYEQINNIHQVLEQYPRYLVQQYKLNLSQLKEVRIKHQNIDQDYNNTQNNQKVLQDLLDIKVQDITNILFITNNVSVSSDMQRQLLGWFLKLEACKKQVSSYDVTLDKLISIREKQFKTISHLYKLIDSGGRFSIPRIVHLFYIKEVQLFQMYPTNLEHLEYLALSLDGIQKTLQVNHQFISNIDLNITNDKLMHQEQIIQITQQNTEKQVQKKKPDYILLQKQYIAELEQRNKFIQQYRQKVSQQGKLKEEYLNNLDRQMQKLQLSKLSTHYNSQIEKSKCIQEKLQITTKHLDILGQMIWIIEDTRYKIFNKQFSNVFQKIEEIYDKLFYQQGIPKKIIVDIQSQYSIIQQYTTEIVNIFKQYKHDPLISQYLKDDLYFVIKQLKKVDFVNYAMQQSIQLLHLLQYYEKFNIEWFYNKYSFDLQFYNLDQYLLYMRKYFEITYSRLQKDCDSQQADPGSYLKMKIQSSANKRQKLYKIMRSASHCYLLRFEIGRYIYYKWTKRIYQQKDIIKQVDSSKKLDKYLNAMLKDKLKYFPKLKSIILPQVKQIELKVQEQLMSKLQYCLYYNWLHDQTNQNMIEQINNPLGINFRKFLEKNQRSILTNLFSKIQYRDVILEDILLTFKQKQLVEAHQQLPYQLKEYKHYTLKIQSVPNQEIRLRSFEPDSDQVIKDTEHADCEFIKITKQNDMTIIDIKQGPKIVAIYLSIPVDSPSLQTRPHPRDNNYYQLVVYNSITEEISSNRYVYSYDDF